MISAFSVYHTATLLILHFILLLIVWFLKKERHTFLLVLLFASTSYFYFTVEKIQIIEEGKLTTTIQWLDQVKIDGGVMKGFVTTLDGEKWYATYRFNDEIEKSYFQTELLPAHAFTVTGELKEIYPAAHRYSFNMRRYLQMNGARGSMEITELHASTTANGWKERLLRQRQKIARHIEETFPGSLVAEAKALLIGDRSHMDEETAKQYQKLGITHLFAISGLHVGLLTLLVRECLLRLYIRRETVHGLLIVSLPIYAVIVGGAPSVWRAVTVTVLILVMTFTKLTIRLDHLLALTAIGFIVQKPYLVLQPGFQLSYAATFALILSHRLLKRATSSLQISFYVTSISQIALYPILLVHFYELSLSSFIVNLLYVPVYSIIILPMNFLLLLVTFISLPIANLLFYCYEPCRKLLTELTVLLSKIPYQLWTPGKPTTVLFFCMLIGIFCFFIALEKRRKLGYCLLYIILPAAVLQFAPYFNSTLRVTFLDVGQGDSIIIEMPYKRAIYVIDTGGTVPFGEVNWRTPEKSFDVATGVLVPYLKGKGHTKINRLIISHPHLDHMGSASRLLEEIKVAELHTAPNTLEVEEMQALLGVADEQNIPIIEVADGVSWREKEASFHYLHPQQLEYVGNDSSLALLMETVGPSFLFTGDMEEKAEQAFLKKYGEVDFGEVILKIAHHGSKTSTIEPFIQSLQPILAIGSMGKNNRFNHPHEEVVERLKAYRIPFLTTEEHQSITIEVKKDGSVILVET